MDFKKTMIVVWGDPIFLEESDPHIRLAWKIRVLKARIKAWSHNNRREKLYKLESLEQEINKEFAEMSKEGFNSANEARLKMMETECNELLRKEEEHWRQKICAIWLKCGDHNTRFFHNFASARRNQKHIWEIEAGNGRTS
jgi:hypothetical protein